MMRFWRGLWRCFLDADLTDEFLVLRARGEALGFAVPRTLAETLADLPRAAARKRQRISWQRPDASHIEHYAALIDLFADMFVAVALIDGEFWLLGERLFAGFPDPDLYTAMFLDADQQVIAAAELNALPTAWTLPVPA